MTKLANIVPPFPELLQVQRKAWGMTQEKLAHVVGITQGTISKLESGELDPTVRDLYALSHILNIPSDTLVRSVCKYKR